MGGSGLYGLTRPLAGLVSWPQTVTLSQIMELFHGTEINLLLQKAPISALQQLELARTLFQGSCERPAHQLVYPVEAVPERSTLALIKSWSERSLYLINNYAESGCCLVFMEENFGESAFCLLDH